MESGEILIKDSTCPALHAQLQATEKSVPFMPLRGVIGSDIQKYRNDWQVIENPMKSSGNKNEPILLLPAVKLDVLIFHAPCVDKNGNIQIGRRRELATLAHASKKVFVTTEQILEFVQLLQIPFLRHVQELPIHVFSQFEYFHFYPRKVHEILIHLT